jgi:hypothetical protein
MDNGKSWSVQYEVRDRIHSVTYCSGIFTARLTNDTADLFFYKRPYYLISSDRGITWTTLSIPSLAETFFKFSCYNDLLIGAGDRGALAWSRDGGVTWSIHDQGIADKILHSSFCEKTGQYVIITDSGVWTSSDPARQSFKHTTKFDLRAQIAGKVEHTAYGSSGYVIVDAFSNVLVSVDTINWINLGTRTFCFLILVQVSSM